jgi:SAM-dependent methyltransferase
MINSNEWNPGAKEFFLSASYLERAELYFHIRKNSKEFNGKLLDIGCGNKPYLDLFNCDTYTGLELNKSYQEADIYYDGGELPFLKNEFDNIVSFQALYQVENLDLTFYEINRILKANGKILITVPFIWFDGGNIHRRFSQEYIHNVFSRFGFEILSIDQTVNNLSALCLLASKYINEKISKISFKLIRVILKVFVTSFFNIIGTILLKFTKKGDDLYINNVVVAKKVIDVQES